MPARCRELLVSFPHCLWRSRLARLYVETLRRLQRCPVGSALDDDATGISRGSLSGTADSLISAAGQFVTDRDAGDNLVDASRHLLLTGSDSVDSLPNCLDVAQDLVELLLIGEMGG